MGWITTHFSGLAHVFDLAGLGVAQFVVSDTAVALAQVVAALFAAAALWLNLRDRSRRDLPILVLHDGRWFSDMGKKQLDEPFLTNEGSGPAFDVLVAFGFEVPNRGDLAWRLGDRPTISDRTSLGTGKSISLDQVHSLVQMYILHLKSKGLTVDRPKISPTIIARIFVTYQDRGRTQYYQTFSCSLKADMDTFPLSAIDPFDFSLLGARDPSYQAAVKNELTASALGLVTILDTLSGPVRRMWPWDRLRREVRKSLEWRARLRLSLRQEPEGPLPQSGSS